MLRTLIVDDEPLAREQIRRLLEGESDIEILGECENGRQAVSEIQKSAPDLVFLDIRMPRLGGLEVLDALEGRPRPAVVFVTAYDEYALPAFESRAADYLVKPVRRARLRESLERARRGRASKEVDALQAELIDILEAKPPPRLGSSRIWFRSPGRMISLSRDQIGWIDAAGNYVTIHVGDDTHRLRQTLSHLEADLDPDLFLRIHRSTIVNIDHVAEIAPYSGGELVLILKSGQRLTVSRTYRERFQRLRAAAPPRDRAERGRAPRRPSNAR